MFEKEYEIHTYEVDAYKRLTVLAIFEYFQDVMMHNADSYGAGDEFHDTQDMIWVLIDYEIDVREYPYGKQTIIAKTFPYSFKRFYGYRVWELTLQDGTVIATGKGKFILINKNTKQIETPTPGLIAKFKDAIQEPKALNFTKNKPLKASPDTLFKERVKPSDIDINHHMNNIKYVEKAYNTLPYDLLKDHQISTVRVTYKKESIVDDTLQIKQKKLDDIYLFQVESKQEIKAIIRMTYKPKARS